MDQLSPSPASPPSGAFSPFLGRPKSLSEAQESRRVLEEAGPAQALALFGGRAGKVIAAVDSQIEQRVDSARGRLWIRLFLFGSIVAALFWWLLSNTHSPPGW